MCLYGCLDPLVADIIHAGLHVLYLPAVGAKGQIKHGLLVGDFLTLGSKEYLRAALLGVAGDICQTFTVQFMQVCKEGTEYGTLKVSCTADGSIDAASDDTSRMPAAPSVPQAGDFTLTVTGESGTQKWDTLTEFEQSDAVFRMGTYTVSVAHGDPDAEGIDKPYYAAEKRVEVLPRRAATVEMTATIANSQTVVRATEQFLNYFHDAQFTVTTASGNQFDFTPGSTPADEPVFVKSATTLKVTGTARRQSQTGTDEGPKVTFSEQTLEATSPRTCHVLTFDAKDAGSVTLTVTLSDDYTETRPIDCEVNEGAIDDTK